MSKFSIFNYFPPPAYLRMPTVGFDVSTGSIRYIELKSRTRNFEVAKFGKHDFEVKGDGVTSDEKVKEVLSEIKAVQGIKFVSVALPEEKAYLFKTEIPLVEDSAIRSTIEFKLEEQVPIPAGDSIFDYSIINNTDGSSRDHIDVGVTVLPKAIVSSYVDLFEEVGLTPIFFEIEHQALARAVIKKGDRKTYLLVNFAQKRTGLSIVSDSIVHFSSTVTIGGDSLTSAIKKHLNVNDSEAVKIKKNHGFVKNKENVELFFSLMSTMSALRDEINHVVEYWRTRDKSKTKDKENSIEAIILCGSDVTIEGFSEYFSLSFGIPVLLADVWTNVASLDSYTPPISFDESFDYAIAIGLALPQN